MGQLNEVKAGDKILEAQMDKDTQFQSIIKLPNDKQVAILHYIYGWLSHNDNTMAELQKAVDSALHYIETGAL